MPIVFLRTIYKDFPFLSHNLSSQLEKREFSAGDSTTTYLLLCHEEQNILLVGTSDNGQSTILLPNWVVNILNNHEHLQWFFKHLEKVIFG